MIFYWNSCDPCSAGNFSLVTMPVSQQHQKLVGDLHIPKHIVIYLYNIHLDICWRYIRIHVQWTHGFHLGKFEANLLWFWSWLIFLSWCVRVVVSDFAMSELQNLSISEEAERTRTTKIRSQWYGSNGLHEWIHWNHLRTAEMGAGTGWRVVRLMDFFWSLVTRSFCSSVTAGVVGTNDYGVVAPSLACDDSKGSI